MNECKIFIKEIFFEENFSEVGKIIKVSKINSKSRLGELAAKNIPRRHDSS